MTRPRPPHLPKPKPAVVVKRERRAHVVKIARAVRAAVWRRDGGRCRACQRGRGADVHHVQYRSQLGRWTTANCVLLCRTCHQEVHAQILTVTGENADTVGGLTFGRRRWW